MGIPFEYGWQVRNLMYFDNMLSFILYIWDNFDKLLERQHYCTDLGIYLKHVYLIPELGGRDAFSDRPP